MFFIILKIQINKFLFFTGTQNKSEQEPHLGTAMSSLYIIHYAMPRSSLP
jgi:hypothetical protein